MALFVYDAEIGLGCGIALLCQRSPQPHSRRMVTALVSGQTLLKWSSNCSARRHQGENDTGQKKPKPVEATAYSL
jgi:hypothetical protein